MAQANLPKDGSVRRTSHLTAEQLLTTMQALVADIGNHIAKHGKNIPSRQIDAWAGYYKLAAGHISSICTIIRNGAPETVSALANKWLGVHYGRKFVRYFTPQEQSNLTRGITSRDKYRHVVHAKIAEAEGRQHKITTRTYNPPAAKLSTPDGPNCLGYLKQWWIHATPTERATFLDWTQEKQHDYSIAS